MSAINEALRYPTARDDWLKTILIGGVLSLFGFLFLPLLPVYGYLVRVIRHRLDGDPRPPRFEEWETLVIDGIRALVIGIVYAIIPGLVAAVTIGGSILSLVAGSQAGPTAGLTGLAGLAGGLLLSFVLSVVFGYVGVAGLVNFVREDRLGAAFEIGVLRSVVVTGEYATAWLVSLVVFIAASIVIGFLNVIPFLGAIIGPFVFFFAQIVAANLWTDGYTAARGDRVAGGQGFSSDSIP